MDPYIRTVADWIQQSKSTVVFTGAGISTESGIPDFRSPGGVWTKYRTVYIDEFMESETARHEYWVQKAEAHQQFKDAAPNVGHQVIARWEASQTIRGVITQNIDGLHQIAGNQEVLELHGTAREIVCMDCRHRFAVQPLVDQFLNSSQVPLCQHCETGRLKHATVSFGQMLPEDILQLALGWCATADVVISIGSSLVVYPAADLPAHGKRNGAKLVIVNRDETGLDSVADVVLNGSCGEILAKIDQALPIET